MSTEYPNGNGGSNGNQPEHALRASELSYRRLFEAAKDGILILDVETGRITDANPFLLELLRFSKSEVLGKTVGELSPFKDIESNKLMLEHLQKDGYVRYDDLPLKTSDGRHIAVEFVCNVYPAGDRQVIQCNVRDITARKKSDEHLAMLSTCVANLNDIVLVTEADPIETPGPKIVFVNAAFERITGYSPTEAIGQSPRLLQGAKTDRRTLGEIHQALARGQPIKRQLLNYRKDGTEYWMDIDIAPVLNIAGKCTHFVAIERDVTESRKLKESLKLFRTLMDRSPDAIEVIDPVTGRFLDFNETSCQRLGYTRDEMLSLSIPDVLDTGDVPFSMQANPEESRRAGARTIESRHRRKDGSSFPIEINTQYVELDRPYLLAVVRDITERHEMEQTLRENEAKFRTLFEVANDANFILHNGVFVDCNAKALELFGATRDEIIGQSPALFSPSFQPGGIPSQEKATKFIQGALGGQPQFFEWVHQRLDGRPVESDISLSRFELGGKIYIQAIVRDISERKEVEKQLLWKTAFFEAQVHSALDGILIVDVEGKKVLQNQRMIELWNIPLEFADEADDDRRRQWVASQTKDARQFLEKVEYLNAHPDEISQDEIGLNNGKCFDRYSAPVRGRDGKYYGRIWSFRDVTERKHAEDQITEQATFLDKAQDAIFVRDLEGKILFWNKGAERMYGWTSKEVVNRKMDELLYTHPKELKEAYRMTISQGDWHGELQHFTKDGDEIMIESRWTLIRDNEGLAKSVLAINTDITEKKMIEAQFMRAQRMESIGTLAGGIAHDLNNILAPIMMSIELLKQTSNDPVSANILQTIEVSAKRGADIVRQVLSFARGLEGERIEVQLKHLLNELQAIIKDTFPKDIRLQFSVPNDIWTILGDPTQVHQILLNLCVNARDAMPNGGSLSVNVENCVLDEHYASMNLQAKAGRYVQISVADTGTGIPPTLLEKIFEPFFTTKAINKGTGLGLSTVMAIVKSHGGLINVYSEPNKGTTFKVYLPAMEMSSEARKEQLAQASLPRGNGETVLLVDDEASILTITTQTLLAFGYHVLTATDGAEAVAVYAERKNDITVVLTDMAMPIMDGAATIRALTKMNPRLKIIAASGLHANNDIINASGVGIKHFLTKPYTAGLLLKTLRTILDEA
jgi:PAS domain S-box-containing protein